jgi:hypothetical protein
VVSATFLRGVTGLLVRVGARSTTQPPRSACVVTEQVS